MGVDLLDLTFRVEKEFQIRISKEELHRLLSEGNTSDPPAGAWTDIRVVDFVTVVETAIQSQLDQPATGVFERVRKHIVECLHVEEAKVTHEAWLIKDLGME